MLIIILTEIMQFYIIDAAGVPAKCKVKSIELETTTHTIVIDDSLPALVECNIFDTKEELLKAISDTLG